MKEEVAKRLYYLSLKAYRKGEVPVAAIIIKDNKIIAEAYNTRKSSFNPLYHAEIRAIIKASKKLKDWRLSNCDLYVTLSPCHMCEEVIKESRIRNTYYFLKNTKDINYKTSFLEMDNLYSKDFKDLLTNFFKIRR